MRIRTEGIHTAEFLISEGNGQISREVITLAPGPEIVAGTVLAYDQTTQHYGPYSATDENGFTLAESVLYATVPASEAPRTAVAICRQAEVQGALLTGLDAAAKGDLLRAGIVVR